MCALRDQLGSREIGSEIFGTSHVEGEETECAGERCRQK